MKTKISKKTKFVLFIVVFSFISLLVVKATPIKAAIQPSVNLEAYPSPTYPWPTSTEINKTYAINYQIISWEGSGTFRTGLYIKNSNQSSWPTAPTIEEKWEEIDPLVGYENRVFYWTPNQCGTFDIRISADDLNQIVEYNENDNYIPSIQGHTVTVNCSSPSPQTSTKFNQGDYIKTTTNVHVRANPGINEVLLGTQPKDMTGAILDGNSVYVDGYHWWQVTYDDGQGYEVGWSAEGDGKTDWLVLRSVTSASNPSTNVSAGATSIGYNQSTIISWSSKNAIYCSSSDIDVFGLTEGSSSTGPLTQTKTFSITCHGASGTVPSTVTTTINVVSQIQPSTKFNQGDRIKTNANSVHVRANPGTSAVSLGTQPLGMTGTIIDSNSVYTEGYHWWQVTYDDGQGYEVGWSAENYLDLYSTTPPSSGGGGSGGGSGTGGGGGSSGGSGGSSGTSLPVGTWVSDLYLDLVSSGGSGGGSDNSSPVGTWSVEDYLDLITVIPPTLPPKNDQATNPPIAKEPIAIGKKVVTTSNLKVRETAGISSKIITTEDAGTTGIVLAGPIYKDGYTWWFVKYEDGIEGWSADAFLVVVPDTYGTNAPGTASLKITSFVEKNGQLSIEAENFTENIPKNNHSWEKETLLGGYSGTGYVSALPETGMNNDINYKAGSPVLKYPTYFNSAGKYYVWVRGTGANGGDSVHIGLDDLEYVTSDRIQLPINKPFEWTRETMDMRVATLSVPSAGNHTLNLWMREDGSHIDKIILTKEANFSPIGEGLAESLIDIAVFVEPPPPDTPPNDTINTPPNKDTPPPPPPPPLPKGALNPPYPRLSAFTWGWGVPWYYSMFDLVNTSDETPTFATEVKKLNPNTIMTTTRDINAGLDISPFPDEWKTRTSTGQYCDLYFPGQPYADYTDFSGRASQYGNKTYGEYIADRFASLVDLDYFDGWATDGLYAELGLGLPPCDSNIDLDRNGKNDFSESGKGKDWIDQQIHNGAEKVLQNIRTKLNSINPNKMMIVNSGGPHTWGLQSSNGFIHEHFPGHYSFDDNKSRYDEWMQNASQPAVPIVNADTAIGTSIKPERNDYMMMRYGLTFALITGAYFDFTDYSRAGEHYWVTGPFDEYDTNLGYPLGPAVKVKDAWLRFFDNGVAIVNGTDPGSEVTINDGDIRTVDPRSSVASSNKKYYRFLGNQDQKTNNGQEVTSANPVVLKVRQKENPIQSDGIILMYQPTTVVADIIIDNWNSGTSPGSLSPGDTYENNSTSDTFSGFSQLNDCDSVSDYYTVRCNINLLSDSGLPDEGYHSPPLATATSSGAEAVYTPTINVAGSYEVFEWHGNLPGDVEGTEVAHEINFGNGAIEIKRNQQQDQGKWNSLGIYKFDKGTSGNVTIKSNGAKGTAIADAIRFVYKP